MMYNTKNGSVKIGDTSMDFVYGGRGEKKLIILPGLSEGLTTVKGKAIFLLHPYRKYFDRFTVYMFSRKKDMPKGYSMQEMAADQAAAMTALGIDKACVLGVSQGGMIAQYLAIDHPALVEKLVIAVSAPRVNNIIREYVSGKIETALAGDHKTLMIDTMERSYSQEYLRKYRWLYPVFGHIGKPKSYDRFLVNAIAILGFDVYDKLDQIAFPCETTVDSRRCGDQLSDIEKYNRNCHRAHARPTLIIAGEDDKIVGVQASREMHERIPGSELYIYPGLGHAAFDEAKDFNERVFSFFEK